MRRTTRWGALALSVTAFAAVPVTGGPVSAAAIRVDSDLGGYVAESEAAPFKVLVDDPSIPIPRNPGTAILEADPAYTFATVTTGANARAIASSVWPGNLIGSGFSQLAPGAGNYPVQAFSSYPGEPNTAKLDAGAVTMESEALGLDVVARATSQPREIPGAAVIGNATSTSATTIESDAKSKDKVKDVVVGRTTSKVSDVSLLGLVEVGSVVTTVESRSDAVKGASSGTTKVAGLTVAGQGFVVDDKGVRPVGAPVPGSPFPSIAPATDLLETLGITIEPVAQVDTGTGTGAARTAKGLRITVDTVLLRQTIDMFPQLSEALAGIFAGVPEIPMFPGPQPQNLLFYTLSATPKITYVLGAGSTSADATLPIVLDFPSFPAAPPLPPLPGTAGSPGTPGTAGTPGTVGGAPLAGSPGAGGPAVAPEVAAPSGGTGTDGSGFVLAGASDDPFKGVGPLGVLAAVALALLGARVLGWLQGAALAGGVLGGKGCALGAPEDLPDLRQERLA